MLWILQVHVCRESLETHKHLTGTTNSFQINSKIVHYMLFLESGYLYLVCNAQFISPVWFHGKDQRLENFILEYSEHFPCVYFSCLFFYLGMGSSENLVSVNFFKLGLCFFLISIIQTLFILHSQTDRLFMMIYLSKWRKSHLILFHSVTCFK